MLPRHRSFRRFVLFSTLALGCLLSRPLFAATWTESGDAGELPVSAQETLGSGTLDSITGQLQSDTDVDLYCIRITDPSSFSALFYCTAFADNDVWLFDANGYGVAADDGCTSGYTGVTSTFVPGPGLYYLGISGSEAEAVSALGSIWSPPADPSETAPDGPGAPAPLTQWSYPPSPPNAYGYTLLLTGCSFCDGPVPALPATWGRVKALYR